MVTLGAAIDAWEIQIGGLKWVVIRSLLDILK